MTNDKFKIWKNRSRITGMLSLVCGMISFLLLAFSNFVFENFEIATYFAVSTFVFLSITMISLVITTFLDTDY